MLRDARNTALVAAVLFLVAVVALMPTPFGGWLQSLVYGAGVRWEDAYHAFDAKEPSGSVVHLEFYPDTTVPIPRGFRTTRWVQLDGCPQLSAAR